MIRKYPALGQLYAALKEFLEIMFSKKPEKLGQWLDNMGEMEIPEISSFVEGTKKDIKAAQNSIAYGYNNGLAEGSVNKIKVIKRIMYGRNSFELLKLKYFCGKISTIKSTNFGKNRFDTYRPCLFL